MEYSRGRNLGPALLNYNLFVTNGVSLKFYLHGYDENDSRGMTQIIEAFGGKSSELPHAPDTFVFCEQSRSSGADSGDLYDIKYFYDSIVALEPKELKSYKFEGILEQHIACYMDVEDSKLEEDGGGIFDDSEDSMEPLHITSDEDECSSTVDDNQPSHLQNEGNDDESPKITHRLKKTTNERSTIPIDDDQLTYLHCNGGNDNFDGEDCIDEDFSCTESQHEQTSRQNSCTPPRKRVYNGVRECSVKIKRLIDKRIEVGNKQCKNNHQDNDDYNEGEGARCLSSFQEDEDSGNSWVPQTNDDNDKSESDEDDLIPPSHRYSSRKLMNKTPSRTQKSTLNGTQNKERGKLKKDPTYEKSTGTRRDTPEPKPKTACWTEKENRVMIQYLVDNDVISRARSLQVWSECLKARKSLLHSTRTSNSLCLHFNQKLRYSYTKYTDDPEALKKFKKIGIVKAKKRSLWTEKESRVVMKYLIDNDVIHRSRSRTVWRECLEACKLSLNPMRTWISLREHFQLRLRHEYAKYTDDPEALRKFKAIEETSEARGQLTWTEEENRELIQYLIDRDVIHRARSVYVWNEYLKTCKTLPHSTRTAESLKCHFNRQLRYSYAKYTDDPDALEKFKKICSTGERNRPN